VDRLTDHDRVGVQADSPPQEVDIGQGVLFDTTIYGRVARESLVTRIGYSGWSGYLVIAAGSSPTGTAAAARSTVRADRSRSAAVRQNPPLRRGDGEEAPLAGHALELVSAAIFELES